MTIALILFCLFMGGLIYYLLHKKTNSGSIKTSPTLISDKDDKTKLPCILCGTPLQKHEKMHSKEVKGEKDSIVYMYGCPHCYGPQANAVKTCPICKRQIPYEAFLTGRMWKTRKGKMHLHISSCPLCARKKT